MLMIELQKRNLWSYDDFFFCEVFATKSGMMIIRWNKMYSKRYMYFVFQTINSDN